MKTRNCIANGLPRTTQRITSALLAAAPGGPRRRRQRPALLLRISAVLPLLVGPIAFAQYALNWSTIDGGGGTSTGGVYSVSGTIGQPDAGPMMSGGNYSVVGGFWSLLSVVQTPGAPLLTITLTGTNTVLVSWPSPSTGWSLQENRNGIGTGNWTNIMSGIQDDSTIKYLVVNPPTGNRFYRLFKP